MYRHCRQQDLFSVEISTGSGRSARTMVKVVTWTTGLGQLPEPGGMLDQPYRLMEFFQRFIDGDRISANNRLKATS